MYIVDTNIVVNWILPATDSPLGLADLDIYITPPGGEVVYINGAITGNNYIAPTVDTHGTVSYVLTPDILGLWKIVLASGENEEKVLYTEYKIKVSINDTYTKFFVRGSLL